jgi:hypothetical protein
MSDQFSIAVLLCVVAAILAQNDSPWIALFVLLVAADMVSKS